MVLVTATAAGSRFGSTLRSLRSSLCGFATPLLLATAHNRELELFSYLVVLNFATLLLVLSCRWHRLLLAPPAGIACTSADTARISGAAGWR
jgi:uncharacterized membrane protein